MRALLLAMAMATLCVAQESYSGLDDDYGNQVGRQPSGGGGIMTYAQALQKAQQVCCVLGAAGSKESASRYSAERGDGEKGPGGVGGRCIVRVLRCAPWWC